MIDFWYCLGVELDEAFMEHTCKRRENCMYYNHEFFRKFADRLDRCDFLVCMHPCKYFIPRHEEVKIERNDEDIFGFG